MSQKRDVTKLNNENPVNRRLAGGRGLGNVLDGILNRGVLALMSAPGLAIGESSKAKVENDNAVYYVQGGSFKLFAADQEIAFTATSHDITAHATLVKEAWYAISINTSGVGVITKGATATVGSGQKPATPAGNVLMGYVNIQVDAGSTDFDATTDELDESHLTTTFYDAEPGTPAADLLV